MQATAKEDVEESHEADLTPGSDSRDKTFRQDWFLTALGEPSKQADPLRLKDVIFDEFLVRYKAAIEEQLLEKGNHGWSPSPREFEQLFKPTGMSRPLPQFKSQVARECERLIHQLSGNRYGRKQTLPWNCWMDLYANAENNVRSRWVEQGIWGHNWGDAWPDFRSPMKPGEFMRGEGPAFGCAYEYIMGKTTTVITRWAHEEPIFAETPGHDVECHQWRLQQLKQIFESAPKVRDVGASRPNHQFEYQLSKEYEWIKDELDFREPGHHQDVNRLARYSLRENWIRDGIWNPAWGALPGSKWEHEMDNTVTNFLS
ncbi:hypothetical protein CEP53_001484 [Fusarium sp. AF-6]|nr:hypothetical protein CEP53_001484 [Fusarium sp. AF-6]